MLRYDRNGLVGVLNDAFQIEGLAKAGPFKSVIAVSRCGLMQMQHELGFWMFR